MSDLPPLEEPQAYVVVGPEDQRGPYTLELLIGEVLAGRLSEATPVWWPGLADWTTMGGHPGVAGEIHRRRDTSTSSAPGWSDPSATSSAPQPTYAQPAQEEPYSRPAEQPSYGDQPAFGQGYGEQPSYGEQPAFGQGHGEQPSYGDQPSYGQAAQGEAPSTFGTGTYDSQQVVYEQAAASSPATEFSTAPSGGEEHGAGTLIDVDSTGAVSWVSDTESGHGEQADGAFEDLVSRSARRSGDAGRVASAEQALLDTASGTVAAQGFTPRGRRLVDGAHELRFDGTDGTELVVTMGRVGDLGVERAAVAVVPFSVTARSGAGETALEASGGGHGEVVVVADEWTGQVASSVSLHLGLEDYLDRNLTLDRGAFERDVAAAVGAVRSRLR